LAELEETAAIYKDSMKKIPHEQPNKKPENLKNFGHATKDLGHMSIDLKDNEIFDRKLDEKKYRAYQNPKGRS
jgi:hypothetical protein